MKTISIPTTAVAWSRDYSSYDIVYDPNAVLDFKSTFELSLRRPKLGVATSMRQLLILLLRATDVKAADIRIGIYLPSNNWLVRNLPLLAPNSAKANFFANLVAEVIEAVITVKENAGRAKWFIAYMWLRRIFSKVAKVHCAIQGGDELTVTIDESIFDRLDADIFRISLIRDGAATDYMSRSGEDHLFMQPGTLLS